MKSSYPVFLPGGTAFKVVRVLMLLVFAVPGAQAVITVSGNSLEAEVDPGTGLPFAQVAKVTNADGSHASSGSAVYLGGGYLLTANHVSLSQGHVSFDGQMTYAIKPGSAVQVASGVDLQLFQLNGDPGLAGVNLFPSTSVGFESSNVGHLVGWGVGASASDDFTDSAWTWGGVAETSAKRWGTNWVTGATHGLSYSGYNYAAIITELNTAELPIETEAGASLYDSGGGLFIEDAYGDWFLMGVTTCVTGSGSSAFASEDGSVSGDYNYFARVGFYEEAIQSLMSNPVAIPEPEDAALLCGAASLLLILVRRRRIHLGL